MSGPHVHAVWDAPDRDAALAAAVDSHGENGSKLLSGNLPLAPTDRALFNDPEWRQHALAEFPAMFSYGLEGYTDDRIADNPGWVTFDVTAIRCPVIVVHGGSDTLVDVIHAHHTAEIVPGAELRIFDDLGHFSIIEIPAITDLLSHHA